MQSHKKLILVFLIVLSVAMVTAMATLRGQNGNNLNANDQQKTNTADDKSQFPIVDYSASESADPEKRAKRQAKGKKYNNKYAPPIDESSETIFSSVDWDANLPALPVAKSQAVIIGEVTDAQAHLSDDKTAVYSEFKIQIDEVLKNDSSNALSPGGSVAVERNGGRVRFPSGHTVVSFTNHQRMPRVGGRYVLFLTHSFPTGEINQQDFYILTGYELRGGRVFPLDNTNPGHPITAYKEAAESSFLKDLNSAVANSSPMTQTN